MKISKLVLELSEIIQEKKQAVVSYELYFEGFYKAAVQGETLFDCIIALGDDVNGVTEIEYCSMLLGYALGQSHHKYGVITTNTFN